MKTSNMAKQSLLAVAMCLAQGLISNTSYAQNFEWAKAFGGTSYDGGSSVSIDASGNVYTTGWFSETTDFDPGTGTANLTAAGDYDIFVQKMSQGSSGILKTGDGIKVLAYPNPGKGWVYISFEKPLSDDVAIKVTDVQGKVVFSKQGNAVCNEKLNIEGPAGIYFLSVNTPKGQSVVKLIKE